MKTILLVEDNDRLRQLYHDVLVGAGYSVHLAENGEIAVDLLTRLEPDLILMDINMPVLDGLATTRRIRSDERWAEIPIFALTSAAMPEEIEQGLDAGCDGYLIKPMHPDDLLPELQNVLALLE